MKTIPNGLFATHNCHECKSKNDGTNVDNDESSSDNTTIVQLAAKPKAPPAPQPPPTNDRKRPAAASPTPGKKKPTKKKKKAPRPSANYKDDATADPSSWTFPTNRPAYVSTFLEFMSFVDSREYTRNDIPQFTKAKLLTIKPKHVLAFLTHKAFGKTKRKQEDQPVHARSNHIKNMKMKISHFMPNGAPWVDLPDGSGHGNPTRHKSINQLIGDIVKFEIRGEGSEAKDVRDMTIPEFTKELELLREENDPICRFRNTLMGIYSLHFITRCDDICNFKVNDPKGNVQYDFALSQQVTWSKNVRDSRNCPDQLILASSDHNTCIFLALGLWLEYFLGTNPEAEYMMTPNKPQGKTEKEHKKFINAIEKMYRNKLLRVAWCKEEFRAVYCGNDKRPLGLHSKRKMAATTAKRRGAPGDCVCWT